MSQDLLLMAAGFLLFLGIIGAFKLKGHIETKREVDPEANFTLQYEIGLLPKFASIAGAMLFLVGAIEVGVGDHRWLGFVIACVGVACIGFRYYAQKKYIFKPGCISCFKGGQKRGEFLLDDIIGMVRVDYGGGISLLGLETNHEAPIFMPKAGFFTKAYFYDYPKVSIVFSSESAHLHADALLKEITARMPNANQIEVHHVHHAIDF